MPLRWLLPLLLALAPAAFAQSRVGEPQRTAAEFFIQRSGARWVYQSGKSSRATVSITSFIEWKATWSLSWGKRTASGTWRIKDNNWVEHAAVRGPGEYILLPAVMREGTRWSAPASVERGTATTSQYEVMALDATVEVPSGTTVDHCVAVLETEPDGSKPWTHYYAANIGKVAVRAGDEWVLKLSDFTSGGKAHAE